MLLTMFREIVKLCKQFRGTKNMFGYKSTEANQLYLLYCICGKIYFTDKIHPSIKYLWLTMNLCGVSTPWINAVACLLRDTTIDARKFIDIITTIGVATDISVIFPSIVYYYRDRIEAMIEEVDELYKPSSEHEIIEAKTLIILNFSVTSAMICIHSFICILDVVLLYEDEKVKDFRYYVFPLPNTEENGSSKLFALNCLLVVFSDTLHWPTWTAGVTLISIWSVACHNEFMYIRGAIESKMDELDSRLQEGSRIDTRWSRAFDRILIQHIEAFNKANKVFDNFKGFVQLYCSLAIPVNFLVQAWQLLLVFSVDMPWSVRLKCISYFAAASWPMFLVYWVGEILENAVSAVSLSVYCSPWYRSIDVRNKVLIFLSQTQKTESLFMWKVYPLVLRNYSRLIHAILSTVSYLRMITLKYK